jgi:hypothetical protein
VISRRQGLAARVETGIATVAGVAPTEIERRRPVVEVRRMLAVRLAGSPNLRQRTPVLGPVALGQIVTLERGYPSHPSR